MHRRGHKFHLKAQMYLFALAIFWAVYIFVLEKSGFMLFLLIAATATAYFKFKKDLKKTHASNNVVVAAETYRELNEDAQLEVQQRAEVIIRRCGWTLKDITFDNDTQRFGWYALAMAELGFPPVCMLPSWNFVANPWLAVIDGDKQLEVSRTTMNRSKASGKRI